jgi:Right handed beta helix region
MRRFLALSLTIAALAISLTFIASPAHAQATRTWVSGVGDDANPCSRTAPCKTFFGAIQKTAVNGEINCLDPGGFGAFTITQSITIDCHENVGAILNQGSDGIDIAFDSFAPSDTLKTVNLRNLMLQGASTGNNGISLYGVGQGSFVNIEDCLITGNAQIGIFDNRDRGTLVINNTTVRSNGLFGISISSASNGSLRTMISNTRVVDSVIGIRAVTQANIVLSHSVVSNNLTAGLAVADTSGVFIVDSTTIAHNGNGIQNSIGTVEISNSDVTYNTAAVSGSVNSFSNNRFTRNITLGTIIPIGTASNPTGQQ